MHEKQDSGVLMTRMGSVLHFLVDGLCICCLYAMVVPFGVVHLMGIFITYNVLAFGTQPLTGLWADAMRWKHWMLLIGDVLLAVGVLVASLVLEASSASIRELVMFSAATFLGLGNSLFHVWGGKQTAVTTGNDIRALGVSVSTGALGLAVGFVCRSWTLLYGLLLAIVAVAIVYLKSDGFSRNEEGGMRNENSLAADDSLQSNLFPLSTFHFPQIWLLVVALMLFVCCRSFASEMFSGGITKTQELILLIAVFAMLGKMAGGWIARWMGIWRSLAVILVGVVLCFVFGGYNDVVLLAGVFLMNCTMPVTLYLANVLLPRREGLAFGLLAAALIPGYLLAVYW